MNERMDTYTHTQTHALRLEQEMKHLSDFKCFVCVCVCVFVGIVWFLCTATATVLFIGISLAQN